MEGSDEEKILGTIMFIRSLTERELAEFIVNQNNAIDGLNKNNISFVNAFHKMYNAQLRPSIAGRGLGVIRIKNGTN